jgi:phosphatidylserine/phosphatidylglycerophosphate/cardiolipin synthase-like enzyme
MPRRRLRPILVLILAGALTLPVLALSGNPQAFFTANLTATGPSPSVTVMEQALLDRLDAAAVSIDAAIYDFNRLSIREALIAAHGRGVQVRLVADDDAYENTSYTPHFTALETAGIPIIQDNRASLMHNKFFVIDGQFIWTGSTNLTDNGFTYNHNNSLVFTSTLLADIYTLEFEEMFIDGLFGTAKTDNTTHTLTVNGVPMNIYFSPSDAALGEVIDEVNAAANSIHFGIFFFTDDTLREALIARHQAGVTVTGVWDLLGAANTFSEDELLCVAGIPLKIEDFGGKLHNKFMVIDAAGLSPRVITGSMNWTGSGDGSNDENTLILHDAARAQAYQTAFQEIYDALGPETLCEPMVVHLPAVLKTAPGTPPPTPSPTLTPTPGPTPAPNGNVVIFNIHFDGAGSVEPDEHVDLRNDDTVPIQLSGWTLTDAAAHTFTFPSYTLQPGEVCRVYTDEVHPEWCGFNYASSTAIWNNGGDCAILRDRQDQLIDQYCY